MNENWSLSTRELIQLKNQEKYNLSFGPINCLEEGLLGRKHVKYMIILYHQLFLKFRIFRQKKDAIPSNTVTIYYILKYLLLLNMDYYLIEFIRNEVKNNAYYINKG